MRVVLVYRIPVVFVGSKVADKFYSDWDVVSLRVVTPKYVSTRVWARSSAWVPNDFSFYVEGEIVGKSSSNCDAFFPVEVVGLSYGRCRAL